MSPTTLPIVIIGAGAAGLMAAVSASSGERPVLLLEGTHRPGQKIFVSGGGRCNILPSHAVHTDFVTDGSPHAVRKILSGWPLDAVRRFFETDLDLPVRLEVETGKLFPASNRATSVLDALLTRVNQGGVWLRTGARVTRLECGSEWLVYLDSGEAIPAAKVVLATGGLSMPATGSDGAGLRLAQALGHSLIPAYPALVPLTGNTAAHHALSGISLPVTLTASLLGSKRSLTSQGGFLFTHRGYSGPAVLNIAHVAVRSSMIGGPRASIKVRWTDLDAAAWDALLSTRKGPLLPLLRELLPERLAELLLSEAGLAGVERAQLRRELRTHLVELLTHYELPWTGHEGYKTAEVTGGGIPLNEVDPVTLESRLAPGLHLCGEILDAFGPIGGYNFLWAWVTGRLAGLACRTA